MVEPDAVGLNPRCGYPNGFLHNFWWHKKDKSLESFCLEVAFALQVPDDLPKGKSFMLRVTEARPVAWSIAKLIHNFEQLVVPSPCGAYNVHHG